MSRNCILVQFCKIDSGSFGTIFKFSYVRDLSFWTWNLNSTLDLRQTYSFNTASVELRALSLNLFWIQWSSLTALNLELELCAMTIFFLIASVLEHDFLKKSCRILSMNFQLILQTLSFDLCAWTSTLRIDD